MWQWLRRQSQHYSELSRSYRTHCCGSTLQHAVWEQSVRHTNIEELRSNLQNQHKSRVWQSVILTCGLHTLTHITHKATRLCKYIHTPHTCMHMYTQLNQSINEIFKITHTMAKIIIHLLRSNQKKKKINQNTQAMYFKKLSKARHTSL